jgi:hypothetical protein
MRILIEANCICSEYRQLVVAHETKLHEHDEAGARSMGIDP